MTIRLRISPVFAWYDLWVGVFIDIRKRTLYIFPVPVFGLRVEWVEQWRKDE